MKGGTALSDVIRIQMLNSFVVYVNGKISATPGARSRKGARLLQHLILHHGEPVHNSRLLSILWDEENVINPENALKTLVSRLRQLLESSSPGLGRCIVADRGAYRFVPLPGMTVDVYELEALLEQLEENPESPERAAQQEKLLELYAGDLFLPSEGDELILSRSIALHSQYMDSVYAYLDALKQQKNAEQVIRVCRTALGVDAYDDRLHMELMTALAQTGHTTDALAQYKHALRLNYRYLGVQPSGDMQALYNRLLHIGHDLPLDLSALRAELAEDAESKSASVCEYAVFRAMYNLQMRNTEDSDEPVFFGAVMLGDPDTPLDSLRQETLMDGLQKILMKYLRRDGVITRMSPSLFAFLLPHIDDQACVLLMERVRRVFYRRFPQADVPCRYRFAPLVARQNEQDWQEG